MGLILGIDEAGRGAVLGPLVVAGVVIEAEKQNLLWELGARDSKALSRPRRRKILRALWHEGLRGRVVVIPPLEIDGENLTALELRAMVGLIRWARPEKVVLDPPVGPRAISRFLQTLARESQLPKDIFSAFPHADRDDPVVAAASILAKVVRDGYMEFLRGKFGDIGWGYPGEEKVQKFLRRWVEERGELPPICRKRWRSVQGLRLKLQRLV